MSPQSVSMKCDKSVVMGLTIELILSLGVAILGLFWWLSRRNGKEYYKNIPVPPTVPLLGNALDLRCSDELLSNLLKYMKNHGGIVRVKVGPIKSFLLITDYKMLEFLLSSNIHLKKTIDYRFFERWLGSGLLIGSGPKWKKHRKILTPAFHFQILTNFITTFESCGEVLLQKLSKEVGKGNTDIYPFITLCSLDVICESTMGTSINAQDDVDSAYVHSVKDMCRILMERAVSPVQMSDFLYWFTQNYRTEKKAVAILHEKANSVIAKRSEELQKLSGVDTTKKRPFLDILLEAKVDGKPLSHDDIREEVDTFMFAGHDTTASALSFALYCLANHPDVQLSVYEEQQAVFEGDLSAVVTYAHLQNMKYLEQVIKETLRLYPSVPIYGRTFEQDVDYENSCIRKGDALLMFPFGVHRNPEFFPDPERFDPGRFENTEGRFPYAYIPFSAGPRNCIGQKFAMLEMKTLISKIVRKFELKPAVPQHSLKLVSETVLKSANGMRIKIELRS